MQELDRELQQWQRQWLLQATVPPDLAKSVEAGTRNMRRGLIAEIANTIIIGERIVWAALSRRADVTVLAIAVGILFAVAWTASLLLRRGMAAKHGHDDRVRRGLDPAPQAKPAGHLGPGGALRRDPRVRFGVAVPLPRRIERE